MTAGAAGVRPIGWRLSSCRRARSSIRGDTPGTNWSFSVLRFTGTSRDAPAAYLQAALHGDELPGVAALHYLVPMLLAAERGREGCWATSPWFPTPTRSPWHSICSPSISAASTSAAGSITTVTSPFSRSRIPAACRATRRRCPPRCGSRPACSSCRSGMTSCSICIATTRRCLICMPPARSGRRSGISRPASTLPRCCSGTARPTDAAFEEASFAPYVNSDGDAAARHRHGRVSRPRRCIAGLGASGCGPALSLSRRARRRLRG